MARLGRRKGARRMADELKRFTFAGEATVSVTCVVEATSEREARKMVKSGNCEWECDEVDGVVEKLSLIDVEDA
jgi:hypothetical protein